MEDEVKKEIEKLFHNLFRDHAKEAVERFDDVKGLATQPLYPDRARFSSPRPIAT